MNAEIAGKLIRCHCGADRENGDSLIRKALRLAAANDGLRRELEEQAAFDIRAMDQIGALAIPPDLDRRLQAVASPDGRPFRLTGALKHPAIWAVGVALFIVLGWLVYFGLNRMEHFPGQDAVLDIIGVADDMNGTELEPKAAEAGQLGDWFFSQFGFEDYYVPEGLARLKSAGGRVFKQNGFRVAQVAIEEHQMFFYVFRAPDFGVKAGAPDRWRVFSEDDWCAAMLVHGGTCFVMAFHGTAEEMRKFIATVGPAK